MERKIHFITNSIMDRFIKTRQELNDIVDDFVNKAINEFEMNLEERVTELERRLNEIAELENTADLRIDSYSCGNNRLYRVTNLDTGKVAESRIKLEAMRDARKP